MYSYIEEGETMTELDTKENEAQETAIDPELPICDPHHHFWDRNGNRYLIDDLVADTSGGHNIVSTVFVECRSMYRKDGPEEMRPVGEIEFVRGIATQSASGQYGPTVIAAAIVGHADLTLGEAVAPVLEAQIATAPNRFRGIRHTNAWSADPSLKRRVGPPKGLLFDENFRAGFACLGKFDLNFDAWLYHPQITELVDLARAFPETTIILDHVGGPIGTGGYAAKREEVFENWKKAIAELAGCDNVVVKVGGLGMPFTGFAWHERTTPVGSDELAKGMAPHYLWCIEQFGTDRCMFESNFPVDKVAYSYTVMWNAFKLLSRDFSATERAALFHDTAARVYQIKD